MSDVEKICLHNSTSCFYSFYPWHSISWAFFQNVIVFLDIIFPRRVIKKSNILCHTIQDSLSPFWLPSFAEITKEPRHGCCRCCLITGAGKNCRVWRWKWRAGSMLFNTMKLLRRQIFHPCREYEPSAGKLCWSYRWCNSWQVFSPGVRFVFVLTAMTPPKKFDGPNGGWFVDICGWVVDVAVIIAGLWGEPMTTIRCGRIHISWQKLPWLDLTHSVINIHYSNSLLYVFLMFEPHSCFHKSHIWLLHHLLYLV